MIEPDPAYSYVASRLLMRDVYSEFIGEKVKNTQHYIQNCVRHSYVMLSSV